MNLFRPKPVFAALAVAGLLTAFGAQADPVFNIVDVDFTGGSTSFGYLGQQFTFSDVSAGQFTFDSVGVSTAAGAAVTAFGAPFYDPPQPTTYFDPIRGSGHIVFDGSYRYDSFPALTTIPASAIPSFIGLALTLRDGIHYGFAEFDGTFLVSYGFESMAGVGIDAAIAAIPAVPEPETYALMLAGLAAVGAAARRRRGAKSSAGSTAARLTMA